MCDTLVALPAFAGRGSTVFAKNSDRERNEAQGLELHPATRHHEGSALRLTYITVPQVAHTHACLISRPFWMWGAEMGANDRGVVIGNEAVHSVVQPRPGKALIGMDLVRLGLERGATAAEAVQVMIDLLERHGQGGDCGHLEPFHYHNSFMVADAGEAFVLETVDRWWAVEKVVKVRAISNVLGIGAVGREVSDSLRVHAAAERWLDGDGAFDVGARLYDPDKDVATRGKERCARSTALLEPHRGALTAADAFSILRDHGPAAAESGWSPAQITGRTLCMHAGGGDRRSQTVASLVSEIGEAGAIHWVTGSSAPCLSIFKPVTLAGGRPPQGPAPSDLFDQESPWWRHEALHRGALVAYADFISGFAPERDALEAGFQARMKEALASGGPVDDAVETCWREADAFEAGWLGRARASAGSEASDYLESWAALSRLAGLGPGQTP